MNNNEVTQQSRDSGALVWVLAIFFSWLSSLIFYMTKKEDPFVQQEAKRALNLSINFVAVLVVLSIIANILAFIALILAMVVSLVMLVVFVGWIFICFKNYQAVKNNTAEPVFPIPFITFIK